MWLLQQEEEREKDEAQQLSQAVASTVSIFARPLSQLLTAAHNDMEQVTRSRPSEAALSALLLHFHTQLTVFLSPSPVGPPRLWVPLALRCAVEQRGKRPGCFGVSLLPARPPPTAGPAAAPAGGRSEETALGPLSNSLHPLQLFLPPLTFPRYPPLSC